MTKPLWLLESRTSPWFNPLFPGPLTTFPGIFIKIYFNSLLLFLLFPCSTVSPPIFGPLPYFFLNLSHFVSLIPLLSIHTASEKCMKAVIIVWCISVTSILACSSADPPYHYYYYHFSSSLIFLLFCPGDGHTMLMYHTWTHTHTQMSDCMFSQAHFQNLPLCWQKNTHAHKKSLPCSRGFSFPLMLPDGCVSRCQGCGERVCCISSAGSRRWRPITDGATPNS